eukprot:9898867-Prorocentrum_lima.AAC.1
MAQAQSLHGEAPSVPPLSKPWRENSIAAMGRTTADRRQAKEEQHPLHAAVQQTAAEQQAAA